MKYLIAVIIVLALAIGGIFLANNLSLFNFTPVNRTASMDISSTVKQVLPAAEFVSLIYHYTDIITHSDAIRFFNLGNIPFTERRAIYTIDGSVKLGFNGENIKIASSDGIIIVNMPAIEILSHEIFPETFNLYDERSGLFNRYTLEDSYTIQTIQRHELEKKVNENPALFAQARTSAEQQFKKLLESLPEIKDKYRIIFDWQ